jgi:sugar lactone lactonase YvrE
MARRVWFGFFVLVLLAACSTDASRSEIPSAQPSSPTSSPTSSPQPEALTELCLGEADPVDIGYSLIESGTSAELIWRADFVPWWVRSSPDGRVLAVSNGGDSIYELTPEGTLEIAFRCPGVSIETFAAASDGALWFATRDGGRLYRVAPDGTVSILAESGNNNLEAGPDGSVYALGGGLVRIDSNGERTVINKEVKGRKFATGPNGEVIVQKNGHIVQVTGPGEADLKEIASGYGPEEWVTFGLDGKLYVTHWSGVDVIDLETGSVDPIDWLTNNNVGEAGTFTSDGRLLLYHPNTHVFVADLTSQTLSLFFQVVSNSWAMAVNPGDAAYMAIGNKLPNGQTTIYRVTSQEGLEQIAVVPYGLERSMAFGADGMGYLSLGDTAKGANIFRFNPMDGSVEEFIHPGCFSSSIRIHPQTGDLWWIDCNQLVSVDEVGNRTVFPMPSEGENVTFTITPEGEFYAIVFYHREDPSTFYEHHLMHLNRETQAWVEVADLTQSDPGITMATLTACPDGHVYTVESLDAGTIQSNHSSFNAVRRLEEDGSLTLLGYDFAFDGQAVDCDPITNTIYFTSAAGLFALTPP